MFRIAPPNELRVNSRPFMKRARLLQFALVGAIAVLLCSCEELPQQIQQPLAAVMPTPAPGWWNDEGASGEPRIVVHVSEQKAYFYKGKHLVGESTVSTGKKGFSTPPGHYSIVSKDKNHFSSEFGDYVDLGMAPAAALMTSSQGSAKLLGIEADTGTLEAGKYADIVAVPGDVLKHIRATEHPLMVMTRGKKVRMD